MAVEGLTKYEARTFLRGGMGVDEIGPCCGEELDPYDDHGNKCPPKRRTLAWLFLVKVAGEWGKAWVRPHSRMTTKGAKVVPGWSWEAITELEYLALAAKK